MLEFGLQRLDASCERGNAVPGSRPHRIDAVMTENTLEDAVSLARPGAEELGEAALGEQDRLGERIELEAEQLDDFGVTSVSSMTFSTTSGLRSPRRVDSARVGSDPCAATPYHLPHLAGHLKPEGNHRTFRPLVYQ